MEFSKAWSLEMAKHLFNVAENADSSVKSLLNRFKGQIRSFEKIRDLLPDAYSSAERSYFQLLAANTIYSSGGAVLSETLSAKCAQFGVQLQIDATVANLLRPLDWPPKWNLTAQDDEVVGKFRSAFRDEVLRRSAGLKDYNRIQEKIDQIADNLDRYNGHLYDPLSAVSVWVRHLNDQQSTTAVSEGSVHDSEDDVDSSNTAVDPSRQRIDEGSEYAGPSSRSEI